MLGAEEQALSSQQLRQTFPSQPASSSPRRDRPRHAYSTMKIFRSW